MGLNLRKSMMTTPTFFFLPFFNGIHQHFPDSMTAVLIQSQRCLPMLWTTLPIHKLVSNLSPTPLLLGSILEMFFNPLVGKDELV